MNTDRLNLRVHGRKQAREVLTLVDLTESESVDAFIDEIESTLRPKKQVDEKTLRIERERAFSEFAGFELKFGQYAGMRLDRIPRDYLEWLRDSSEELLSSLDGFLGINESE